MKVHTTFISMRRLFFLCFACIGSLVQAASLVIVPPTGPNPAVMTICTMVNQIYTIQNGAAGATYSWVNSNTASPNPFTIAGSGTRQERGVLTGSLKTVPPGNYTVTINVTESPSGATASITRTFKVFDDPISWNAVSPPNLPRAVQGVNYVGRVGIQGGKPPYRYSLTSGSLPVTLTLNSTTGEIKGIPTDACSSFSFTVSANDTCTGTTINRTFTLPIACPLTVNGTTTFNANMCTPKTPECYTASGGTPPYTWSPTQPVAGLIITVSGSGNDTLCISGTPNLPGNHSITVTAKDSSTPKLTASKIVSIKIPKPATLAWPTCSALPDGLKDTAYSATLSACFASVTGGIAPYTFTIKSGSLPTGCNPLNLITGDITGTPTTAGTFNFTIQATDACGNKVTKLFTIIIKDALSCLEEVWIVVDEPGNHSCSDAEFIIQANGTPVMTANLNNRGSYMPCSLNHIDYAANPAGAPVSFIYPHPEYPSAPSARYNRVLVPKSSAPASGVLTVSAVCNYSSCSAAAWPGGCHNPVGNLRVYTSNGSGAPFSTGWTPIYTAILSTSSIASVTLCPNLTISPPQSLAAMALPNINGSSQTCIVNAISVLPNVSINDLAKIDHLVAAPFIIGKTEVTNEEYCVFLSAVAKKSDIRGLYNSAMGTSPNGGIFRSGKAGAYSYAVKSGMGNYPVVYVSWFDAARYVNWLSNGSPTGLQDKTTTEDGAYALNGATSGVSIVRNAMNPNTKNQPTKSLLNESEWFTSAYLKPSKLTSVSFWNYPTRSDTAPDITLANPNNLANYGNIFTGPTEVSFFSKSLGTFGTLDQGGNVREWTESADSAKYRIIRGGSWADAANAMKASESDVADPTLEDDKTGFRIGGAP